MDLYTVPVTAIYQNVATGQQFSYQAGDTLDLRIAARLGMPGAADQLAELPPPPPTVLPDGVTDRVELMIVEGIAAATLSDLADVTITDPQPGDVLTFSDGVWVNQST